MFTATIFANITAQVDTGVTTTYIVETGRPASGRKFTFIFTITEDDHTAIVFETGKRYNAFQIDNSQDSYLSAARDAIVASA